MASMASFERPARSSGPARRATARASALLVLALAALGRPPAATAETRVGGALRANTFWNKAGSPYVVTEDLVVAKGVTLRVEPGVTVKFKADIGDRMGTNLSDAELIVEGSVVAQGAPGDTVVFTSDATTPRWTDWQGIILRGKAARVELKAANVEYANEGIKVMDGELVASDVTIRLCHQYGVRLLGGKASLDNLLVTGVGNPGGTGVGVNVERAQIVLKNSFILGTQNGVMLSGGSGGSIENTTITLCLGRGLGIKRSDPMVTGNTITGNDYGLALIGNARPNVKGNNIFQNGVADLSVSQYGPETVQLDLSGNWWGTAEIPVIQERILDGLDDAHVRAVAVIEPVLTEAATRPPGRK